MRLERPGLAAFHVGVEDEAPIVDALEQDVPRRRPAVGIHRRQHHGVGLGGLARSALE